MAYVNSKFKKAEGLPEEAYTSDDNWPLAITREGKVYNAVNGSVVTPRKEGRFYIVRGRNSTGKGRNARYGNLWCEAFLPYPSDKHRYLLNKNKSNLGLKLINEKIAEEEGLHWSRTPENEKQLLIFDCVEKELLYLGVTEFYLQIEEKCPSIYERYILPRQLRKDGKTIVKNTRKQYVYEAIRDGHLLFQRFYVFTDTGFNPAVGDIIHVDGNQGANNRLAIVVATRKGLSLKPAAPESKKASVLENGWIQPGDHFTLAVNQDFLEVKNEVQAEKSTAELTIFNFNFKVN